jgi:hypothetical protein
MRSADIISVFPGSVLPVSDLPNDLYQVTDRRSDYDVTNTVCVGSVDAVRDAVQDLFIEAYPNASFDALWMAFHDFDELFRGLNPEFKGCDTVYHDMQHSLDVTLAVARLIAGHQKTCDHSNSIDADRALMGLVTALFHDAGYIRRKDEPQRLNGAEYTIWHVSRSAGILTELLPRLGLADQADISSRLVHFTGYEINIDDIEIDDPRDRLLGYFLGTADLITQVADRCYLEKCRDRLYSEFVLAGIAVSGPREGRYDVLYQSGIDLLRKTPNFFEKTARARLDGKFEHAYRYIDPLFDGRNPYIDAMRHNLAYLNYLLKSEDWGALRRRPPCFTVLRQPLKTVSALVSRHLARLNAPARALTSA